MCRTNFFTAMPAVSVDIVGMPLQSQLCAVTAIWNALTTHGAMHPTPDEIVTGLMAVNAGLETPMVADQLRGGFYTDHITGYLNQIGVQFAMLTPENWIGNLAALQGHPLLINTGNHWTVAADWTAAQITTVNPQNVMAFVDPDTLIYAPAAGGAVAADSDDSDNTADSDDSVFLPYEVHVQVFDGLRPDLFETDDAWTPEHVRQFGHLSAAQAYFAQLAATREEHRDWKAVVLTLYDDAGDGNVIDEVHQDLRGAGNRPPQVCFFI
jgi:hypothetical protein